jgi:hypothetical protein
MVLTAILENDSRQGQCDLVLARRSGNDIRKGGTHLGLAYGRDCPGIVLAEGTFTTEIHHIKRYNGSGCVPGPRTLASVWQSDVKYMCKYSITSFIDHFNDTEHARSHRTRSAGFKVKYWKKKSMFIFRGRPGSIRLENHAF